MSSSWYHDYELDEKLEKQEIENMHREKAIINDFKKNLWHNADEEQPKGCRTVVIWNPVIMDGEVLSRCVSVNEHRLWAYMDDILPKDD